MPEIGYSITANLTEMLASKSINEICKLWKYETHLEKLQQTVSTIQQVFLDGKWDQLSNQDRGFIKKLKDVVYDAEDVFDEFRTRAELNQLGKKSKVRKFFGKVRDIFSSDMSKNKVYYAYRVSRDVMDIKERLDTIGIEHKLFELKFDHLPVVRRSEETSSYIKAGKIIGRDKDKELIIDMLLDRNVKAVTIVGMGGLGKTALAQLLFNDEKIRNEYPNTLWVCVSDQEGEQFDVKTILCKILELVAPGEVDGTASLESVQNQFQEKLKEKKYFLVLDDVWNEDLRKWEELEAFLKMGKGESKIIVTTRSERTGMIVENKSVYRLRGLSHEDSHSLFEMCAFGKGEKNKEFVEIGKKIVRKCHRNPLALKVIGSLLFEQELSKWESVEKSELVDIKEKNVNIMPILKLSFHKLSPSLKSCFSYCAIFPKDFRMNKEVLISLWMSQGFIGPLCGGQTIVGVAEEYFLILMRRCFFQDIQKDKYDNVVSVKIHDLMHDIAKKVAEDEICVVTSKESNLGGKIRHVNIVSDRCAKALLHGSKIRSYICNWRDKSLTDKQVEKLTALRVLQLSYRNIKIDKSLFYSIDRLLLLRYLYLKEKYLKEISNSITRLYNLETLILKCEKLRELPIDFCKLVKVRHLDVSRCGELNGMPMGMGKLTRLTVLPYFVAGGNSVNELQVLQVLTEIKGGLHVKVRNNYNYVSGVNDDNEGEYLKSMRHLTHLTVNFELEDECGNQGLMKNLEPPLNLKGLELNSYKGTTIPWSSFSHQHRFVHISIERCSNLKQIPVLSKLLHLKSLELSDLDSVEYMEDEISSITSSNDSEAIVELFPSLESLKIYKVKKLKGWWKGKLPGMRLKFPRLSILRIRYCRNLKSFASCSNPQYFPEHEFPCLHTLELWGCNRLASNLICPILKRLDLGTTSENLLINCANSQDGTVKLEDVRMHKVGYLNSIPTDCLTRLRVEYDMEVESMLEVEEALQRCASTLRSLHIRHCKNLSRLSGLEHFTALKELKLRYNCKLSICEEDEEPWKSFHRTLRTLDFNDLPQMKSLPKGMRHLTSLQILKLHNCKNAEGSLPEWMSSLSSLQHLELDRCTIKSLPEAIKDLTSLKTLQIEDCPGLKERCQEPNGEDFPKIQHIPNKYIFMREFYSMKYDSGRSDEGRR